MSSIERNKLHLLTSPFRYGRWIDSTVFCLLIFVLVLPLAITYYRHSPSTTYRGDRRALVQKAELITDSLGVSITLQRGDSVDVLGWVKGYEHDRLIFWVETSRGERGYLDMVAFTDSAVVMNHTPSLSRKYNYTARHHGDTVTVKKMIQGEESTKYEVHHPNDNDTTLFAAHLSSLLSQQMGLERQIDCNSSALRPMSEKKFRELYMGRTLAECDSAYLPAIFVAQGRDSLRAIYPVRVFREGKFYRPVVSFSADSVAVGYTIPQRAVSSVNSWILHYLPFYGSVCDLPFVWPTRTEGLYSHDGSWFDRMTQDFYSNTINGISWSAVGPLLLFILSVILLLLRMFFTPLLLPMILYGLLRFPLVFQKVSNRTMKNILIPLAYSLCLGWWFCTLSTNYAIPCAVCQFFACFLIVGFVEDLLTAHKPELRCSACKTLYCCKFDRKEKVGEPTRHYEENTHIYKTVVTHVDKIKTYDTVTVTKTDEYGNKSTSTHEENVRYHDEKHGYYIMGVYKELIESQGYRLHWVCKECGHEEIETGLDRYVVDSELLRTYNEPF